MKQMPMVNIFIGHVGLSCIVGMEYDPSGAISVVYCISYFNIHLLWHPNEVVNGVMDNNWDLHICLLSTAKLHINTYNTGAALFRVYSEIHYTGLLWTLVQP